MLGFDSFTSFVGSLVNRESGQNIGGRDPIAATQVARPRRYDQSELNNLFKTWACKKVVSYYPEMMALGGASFECQSLEPEVIDNLNNWIKYRIIQYMTAQIEANLYGNSLIIRIVDDGISPDEPIDINKISQIEYSQPIDRYSFSVDFNYYSMADPEHYLIYFGYDHLGNGNNLGKMASTGYVRWHKSRVLRFNGDRLTNYGREENSGYDDSVLVKFLEPYYRYTSGFNYASSALKDFEVLTYGITQLFQKTQDDAGKSELMSYLGLQRRLNSTLGWLVKDQEDEVDIISRQFMGVSEILEKCREEMIGASGLTRPQFYQEHPTGLSATGQSERMAEANAIKGRAEQQWGEILRQDVELFLAINNIELNPLEWSIEFESLFAETPLEESRKIQAYSMADKNNIGAGIYTPEEARSRYIGTDFNQNITLNEYYDKEIEEDEGMEKQVSQDIIEKEGNKWILWNKAKTKKLGTHSTREEAVKQEMAIKASQSADQVINREKQIINVGGAVLPLSEYEFIADEPVTEEEEDGTEGYNVG